MMTAVQQNVDYVRTNVFVVDHQWVCVQCHAVSRIIRMFVHNVNLEIEQVMRYATCIIDNCARIISVKTTANSDGRADGVNKRAAISNNAH
jgi:hypothetical protein